jgi:hypothetical protein
MTCTVPRRDTRPTDAFVLHRPLNDPLFRCRLCPLLAEQGQSIEHSSLLTSKSHGLSLLGTSAPLHAKYSFQSAEFDVFLL